MKKRKIRKTGAMFALALGLAVLLSGCRGNVSDTDETSASAEVETTQEATEPQTTPNPTQSEPQSESEPQTKEPEAMEDGIRVILMTDMHYLSPELTDGGAAFQNMIEHGDGKLVNYSEEILKAAFEEAVAQKPDVLILSGDISFNGEKKSHEGLAEILAQVEDEGLTVLVIPGNHDINNPAATGYAGDRIYPAENISPQEFEEIYRNFGYDEAYSRDSHSLSYSYLIGDRARLLMLDSCQYEPRNQVGGMIQSETYDWIEEQLEEAQEEGQLVLPVAHHNLLDESKVYVQDCTIEHSSRLIEMLEAQNVRLFLSGHLHVQHFMQHNDIGIYEIVTSSLATPPCQYGVLEYRWDESFDYQTKQVDMEGWAREHASTDENLLHFRTYSPPTLNRIFYNQARDAMKDSASEEKSGFFVKLTDEEKDAMAKVYADVNAACYAGNAIEAADAARASTGYAMWREYCYPALPYEYLEYIMEDAVKDYNRLSVQ